MRRKRMTSEQYHELVRQQALRQALEAARLAVQKRDKASLDELQKALENLGSISE